jgi:dethiobiotin synthetase
MLDYAPQVPEREFDLPVVLLVGTSMSAGKTTSAKVIVRLLREAGLVVVGAKLTEAGRYRDILAMQDAGADYIFDFVDAGSLRPWSPRRNTVMPCAAYSHALPPLRPTSSLRR